MLAVLFFYDFYVGLHEWVWQRLSDTATDLGPVNNTADVQL